MNKNIIRTSTLLVTSLWASQLLAGSVTIPNTFVSGAAASASEVNANFDAIKTEVDDNDSRITTNANDINVNSANITANTNAISSKGGIGVFVNGVRVGSLLGYPTYTTTPIPILLPSNYIALISPIGEGLYPSNGGGVGHEMVYTEPGCAGQAYAKGESVLSFVLSGQGQLYAHQGPDPQTIYYIPAGTTAEPLTYVSKDAGFGGCTVESVATDLYKAFPNDSNVTGITDAELMGSVTIGN